MIRYIIHLLVETYEPKKKEKKADVEANQKILNNNVKKAFEVALGPHIKAKNILTVKEPYLGNTLSFGIYLDLKEEKIWDLLDALRKTKLVDIMEPEEHVPVDLT